MTDSDIRNYNLARVIAYRAFGHNEKIGDALRLSAELTRAYGLRAPRGIWVPTQVIARGLAFARSLNTSNGEGAVGTTTADPIAALTADAVLVRAGAKVVDKLKGKAIFPRETAYSDPQWVGEGSNVAESSTTYDRVTTDGKCVAAYVDFTRPMLEGISEANKAFVASRLGLALQAALDKAAFSGTGSDGQPLGLDNCEDVNALTFTAGAVTRDEILDAFDAVANASENPERLAWIMHPSVARKLMGTFEAVETDNGELGGGWLMSSSGGRRFMCDGCPVIVSKLATAKMAYLGDWSQLLLAFWGPGVDIVPTLCDSRAGVVRVNAYLDCDAVIAQPAAFGVGQVLADDPEPDPEPEGDGNGEGEGGEGGEGGGGTGDAGTPEA